MKYTFELTFEAADDAAAQDLTLTVLEEALQFQDKVGEELGMKYKIVRHDAEPVSTK